MKQIESYLEQIDTLKLFTEYKYKEEIIQFVEKYKENLNNQVKKQFCQIEIDSLNFGISSNGITSTLSGTNQNGEIFEYPSVKNFSSEDLEYLKSRLENTENQHQKGRYAHILFLSAKRHNSFANIVSDCYLNMANDCLNNLDISENNDLGIYAISLLENSMLITAQIKNKTQSELIRSLIINLARDFSKIKHNYINTSFISFMLKNPKIFKQSDFDTLNEKIYHYAQQIQDNHAKIKLLKQGIDIDKKIGLNDLKWYKEIGECYEKLSYERVDETNLASTFFANDAVNYYAKAKMFEKEKELIQRYEFLKSNLKLGTFSQKIDVTEIVKEAEAHSNKIIGFPLNAILRNLIRGKILPTYDEMLQKALKDKATNSFLFFCNTQIIDNAGNIAEKITTDDEHIYHSILRHYNDYLKFNGSIVIEKIIFKSIKNGKLTPISFFNYMKDTWLGGNITRIITQGEEETYNWLPLIMPSINDYLVQLRYYLLNQSNGINLVQSIDSLTLKVEGIIRDICKLKGISTTNVLEKGVSREKDINQLLREDKLKSFISKDDLLLLKYLLVEKSGLNLRHNIAHSLFRYPNDYSHHYMNLLIIVILTLAKDEYCPRTK